MEELAKIPQPEAPDYDAIILPEKRTKEVKGII